MTRHFSPVAQTHSGSARVSYRPLPWRDFVGNVHRLAVPGLIALVMSMSVLLGSSMKSTAAPLTNLHNFNYSAYGLGTDFDGNQPNSLVLSGTTLYGTTDTGGLFDAGTIFKINTDGTGFKILYDFGTAAADGSNPEGPIVLIGSTLYGTTKFGGTSFDGSNGGSGTVYKLNTDGTGYEILHDFETLLTDGAEPDGGLIASGTTLYGTASFGGTVAQGTAFKINTDGSGYTTLHDFGTNSPDGSTPTGALTLSGSTLYGVTASGGSNGQGTAYKVSTTGTSYQILYNFGANATDGLNPASGLTLIGTTLWGTTLLGGVDNVGTLYHVSTTGTSYVQAHAFGASVADGQYPRSGLTLVGSTLYGTTGYGGGSSSDNGTIYQIATAGTGYQAAYTFGSTDTDGEDAAIPDLISSGGVFYGVMGKGGVDGNGTVYSLNLGAAAPTWTAKAVAAGPNGTSAELWTRSDGAAGLWGIAASDYVQAIGSIYGPYVDGSGAWTAKAVATGTDGTSRVLWTRSDGAAGLWSFDASGNETTIGAVYGPYTGWTAKAVGVSGDGTSRILWANVNGTAGVWVMDENDLQSYSGTVYGPYGSGWTATSLATDASGYSRELWVRGDGAAGIWTVDPLGTQVIVGPTYGPISGYSAKAVGVTSGYDRVSGTTELIGGDATLLWTLSNGSATLWKFDGTDTVSVKGPVYGPYANFSAVSLSTSVEDGTSRVLWDESNGAAGVWTFGTDDAENIIGQTYGPF